MEYELEDEPRDAADENAKDRPHASDADENDSEIIRDHAALKHQSSVHPEDYPLEDRAMFIPEEKQK